MNCSSRHINEVGKVIFSVAIISVAFLSFALQDFNQLDVQFVEIAVLARIFTVINEFMKGKYWPSWDAKRQKISLKYTYNVSLIASLTVFIYMLHAFATKDSYLSALIKFCTCCTFFVLYCQTKSLHDQLNEELVGAIGGFKTKKLSLMNATHIVEAML